jgi:FixJ family two-component response regulator
MSSAGTAPFCLTIAIGVRSRELRNRGKRLSVPEREVMNLVASGTLNKQVAAALGASEATVKMYRSQVMKKMPANSRPELVRNRTAD